jgi:integrase
MSFRRSVCRTWYFQGRVRVGYRIMSTGVTNKALANKLEAMWQRLARDERAWDLLDPVLRAERALVELWDAYVACEMDVGKVRRHLSDRDVEPLVEVWRVVYGASGIKPDSARHAEVHVRWLLPPGTPRSASSITHDWLTQRLAEYPGGQNTRRKVHSSWSVFLEYATTQTGVFEVNPMLRVKRPKLYESPICFYELDAVEQIVAAQPTAERRALYALIYGTGIEVTVLLGLTRNDVMAATQEVRAAGTKAHTRDRVCLVAPWAWPILWEHIQHHLPTARLFREDLHRRTVYQWHDDTVTALGLPVLTVHNARNHWAATRLRAGAPIEVVQRQLGHESPMLTLRKYGRFMPSGQDRQKVEERTTEYERLRRA